MFGLFGLRPFLFRPKFGMEIQAYRLMRIDIMVCLYLFHLSFRFTMLKERWYKSEDMKTQQIITASMGAGK